MPSRDNTSNRIHHYRIVPEHPLSFAIDTTSTPYIGVSLSKREVLDRLGLGAVNLPGRLFLIAAATNATQPVENLVAEQTWRQKRISAGWILVRRRDIWAVTVVARIYSADLWIRFSTSYPLCRTA